MPRLTPLVLLLMLLAPVAPCFAQVRTVKATLPGPTGIVVIVEGIGGIDMLGSSITAACRKAGLQHDVRRFSWTHGKGKFFKDLQDTQHLIQKAQELAATLRELRAAEPDKPIYIVAKSGGTALSLFALESMPPNSIDRTILLSAAVSPSYDLRPALRANRLGIVSYHSTHDQLILNWGTRHFGTADRFYGPSAGLNGFIIPTDLDEESRRLYAKLAQIPWHTRMMWQGNTGGHLGTNAISFLAQEVVPWLSDTAQGQVQAKR
jgi:pimeloyl-ACP methyl ester carboxylesterase